MNIFLIGFIAAVVFVVFLTFIKKDSKYAKFGIHIKRVYCPNCNQKQPIARKPANQRQALFGGYTCKYCNTEMDKYGTEIDPREL